MVHTGLRCPALANVSRCKLATHGERLWTCLSGAPDADDTLPAKQVTAHAGLSEMRAAALRATAGWQREARRACPTKLPHIVQWQAVQVRRDPFRRRRLT
jgi:hypothetical protein